MNSENLRAIVDFLYCGEATVFQENFDSFLAIAEELRLKGLMRQTEDAQKKTEHNETKRNETPFQMDTKPFSKRDQSNMNTEHTRQQ